MYVFQIHPRYLSTNATIHTWAFSAIAELIDNAYDPDVKAKELRISKRQIQGKVCLTFVDNGNGMTPETLHNMMSFGFNDKEKFATPRHQAIGRYGNGFKSGAMRLGKDAIVFTRQVTTMSVGLLSQTYLNNINAETVRVPIVTWNLSDKTKRLDPSVTASLDAILKHSSIFKTEADLLIELADIERTGGTTIIIYNLNCRSGEMLELDFQSDPSDIRDPDTHLKDTNAEETATITNHQKRRYMVSLREYCKILYLKPKMKIWIQGKKVRTLLIRKSLRRSQEDTYKPSWAPNKIPITFGFASTRFDDYGVMLYHYNRLILAYEKLGCQKQTNGFGNDVIAVVEADALEVINNKQDFIRDAKYSTLMDNISKKLRDYWNVKKGNAVDMEDTLKNNDEPFGNWVQCDNCNKWRRLRNGVQAEDLPLKWYCRNNEDPQYNRCDIEEEEETEDVEEEKRRKYRKMKMNQQRLQREKSGTQSRQSLVNNLNRSQTVNESMDQPENILALTGETLRAHIQQSLANNPRSQNVNESMDQAESFPESAGQTPRIEQQPLKGFSRKRNAIDKTFGSVKTEDVMDFSSAVTASPRKMNQQRLQRELLRAQIQQPLANNPRRSQNVNESMDQPESFLESAGQTPRIEQQQPLKGFSRKRNAIDKAFGSVKTEDVKDFSTAVTASPSSCRNEASRKDTPAKRPKPSNVGINQITPTMYPIPQEDEQVMMLRNFCDAETQTKEMIRMCNKECMKIDEELHGKIEREKKKTVDMEKKVTEAMQKVDETNGKLEEANIKVEKAERKIEESYKEKEQANKEKEQANRKLAEANRKLEGANRKVEEAGKKIEESLRGAEISQKKVAMAGRQLQEAARKVTDAGIRADSFESRLREFRRNVYTFLQGNATGDIGTEDAVEDLILAIITDGQR
ncbi:MORC family CW-type zinc finger protein 3-like isoform X2 [Mizuhopecten yessoensis]|uniref:MORC family CW-type zinc finger protein 3-like isoform X2 n=1 Tax=Mizuhopecten yessoensis TaxID=6573 RepID=UPI000B45CAFF|nr:MORC family CW-type zinc finger protein 3-like isoform X2 [Mizuhopecten yessoensis]